MEPLKEPISNNKETEAFLLEIGFPLNLIQKAMLLTNDQEKLVELIIKFQEDEETVKKPQNQQDFKNIINEGFSNIQLDLPSQVQERRYKMVKRTL